MRSAYIDGLVRRVRRLQRDYAPVPDLPEERSRRWAEAVREGCVFFYDRQKVAVGLKDIDWSGRHVAHQEWPAQLNRFFWLPHLAAMYEATGDEQMPALARGTIEDWIRQHDYAADKPIGAGDNTLNLSIRLGQGQFPGWWGTLPAFARSGVYDDEFVRLMEQSTRGQLAYVMAHLTSGGNWRISQLDCVLYCSLALPGLEREQAFAVRHLNEAFHRQIHADGSHEEHTPSYHGWMCRLFTRLWRLGRARPSLGLRIDTERAARMWDYEVCSYAPDGGSAGLHDSGPWRPGPGRIESMEEREVFLREAGLRENDAWDLERQPSRWFRSAGQLFLRSGWKPESEFLVFDATRWGGGHGHLSRLGVSLYAHGRMLLADPGIFSYEMSDPYAAHGKSTPAHNTITIGGLNQTDADPVVKALHVGRSVAVIAARYEGGYYPGRYTWWWSEGRGPGVFGMHDRVLVWLPGRASLVLDWIRTDGRAPSLSAHWQLPAGPVHVDAAGRRAWTLGGPGNVLVQGLGGSLQTSLTMHEGEKDPLRGWLPKADSVYEPAPMLAFECAKPPEFGDLHTLLAPYAGEQPPAVQVEALPRGPGGAFGYRLAWPDGREDLVCATPGLREQVGAYGPLDTDASLAVVSLRRGKVAAAFVLDGMILDYEGRRVIREGFAGPHER